jgi:hypothetical protein
MNGPADLQFSKRSSIGQALVGDPFGWGSAGFLQKFADELSSGSLIPLGLDQHLEDLAFGIDGAPEVHLPTANPNEHFIQVPPTVRFKTPRPQPACNCWSEGEHPSPDSLVGYCDSTLGQELLNIAVARGEAQVEPDRALNNVAREAVAKVGA